MGRRKEAMNRDSMLMLDLVTRTIRLGLLSVMINEMSSIDRMRVNTLSQEANSSSYRTS